jgi:hypothetical protein
MEVVLLRETLLQAVAQRRPVVVAQQAVEARKLLR